MKRVILTVLDSIGIGAMPDAELYGDAGANTLGHIAEAMPDFKIPNLVKLGLGMIDGVTNIQKTDIPMGSYGRLQEMSNGKDTTTGHWEIAGLYTEVPFKTFEKFPEDFMESFEKAIGVKTLGNYAASGTQIIEDLGPEHEKTGKPIIYTSADSVFQIAANTAVIPLEKLYHICEVARKMLVGDLLVGRVIARPYILKDGKRIRTSDRKDYSVSPGDKTVLDFIKEAGKTVYAIGKISDIFNGQGITVSVHTDSNADGINKIIEALNQEFEGLIFANLVDFDSKFGHRRDPAGYGKSIEELDAMLPGVLNSMKNDDILIICADHGNDPAHSGWDHTREYVPVIIYGNEIKSGVNLGTRSSFADIGATISEILEVQSPKIGESFLKLIKAV